MIDWSQVRQLQDDIGLEDFQDVVDAFLEEVDEAVEALINTPPNDDAALEAALHFLKGSAYNLGFVEFAETCSVGEQQARAGAGGDVDLPKLIALYETSKKAFLVNAPTYCGYEAA